VRRLAADCGVQMVLDIADRHPLGIEADDHVAEPVEAPLTLADQVRLEAAPTVAGSSNQCRRPRCPTVSA
jgi:hypothetical protein